MVKISDEQLVQKTFGDNDNFSKLVDRYSEKIRRYLARLTGNWQESEDMTQDVFLKAYQNIASFNPKMKFSAWLYRIAHNEGVNFIKRHYRFHQVEFNDEIKNKFLEDNTALEKISQNEDKKLVRDALLKLNSRDREILELFYFDQNSYQEISDILEMPINSVGSTIKRAKDKLKSIMQKLSF